MEITKYQLPEDVLMEYIEFKRATNVVKYLLPIEPPHLIEMAQEKLEKDNQIDGYYSYRAFIDLYRMLDNHLEFFYPNESDQSRIRQMIKGAGPRMGIPDDIPQALSFTRDNIMVNIDWINDDKLKKLLKYEYLEWDITEIFWTRVIDAHDHNIYNWDWINENKDNFMITIGEPSIRDFMEDIANPNWDEDKQNEEIRKFILNTI